MDCRSVPPQPHQTCNRPGLVWTGGRVFELNELDTCGVGSIPAAEVEGAIHAIPSVLRSALLVAGTQPFNGDGFQPIVVAQEPDSLARHPKLVEVITGV